MPDTVPRVDSSSSILAERGERTLIVGHDRPVRISSGHRILHHDGKCSRPHGHNYEIQVELTGTLIKEGWIADKGDITEIIDEWDHQFLLEEGDPLVEAFEASGDGDAVVILDHPPTAEVMSVVLEQRLLDELGENVTSVAVEVSETGQLCAGAHR
jgi:6-pyruvoyltetrahydropterin/6-carboxytetrahydropterin synthase